MVALWLVSLARRDASIVDSFWGIGFVVLAWLYFAAEAAGATRSILTATLVTIWGVRLSLHIFTRNRGSGEDYRYAAMREKWGQNFWWMSLCIVFGLQGALMMVIAMPLYTAARAPQTALGVIDGIGFAVFATGLLFEVIGDWQLKRFKTDAANRGQTLRTGLWRYTRHPNYFGDALLWWGIYLIGGVGSGAAWTAMSPLLMTVLLMRVSGVPLLEERMRATRPDFADYAASTSGFFPWPPK
jgi:steroid 5-alpha reductase family enzyme